MSTYLHSSYQMSVVLVGDNLVHHIYCSYSSHHDVLDGLICLLHDHLSATLLASDENIKINAMITET